MLRLTLCKLCGILLCGLAQGAGVETIVPEGSAPAPIVSRYFPDRVHVFVWRNWNVVEPARLAAILGTSVEQVQALATATGLPPAETIPPEMKTRGYICSASDHFFDTPVENLKAFAAAAKECGY